MIERLKSCDVYHANKPARMTVGKAGRDRRGNYRYADQCLECQRIKRAHQRVVPGVRGVLPSLNWPAPEFIKL